MNDTLKSSWTLMFLVVLLSIAGLASVYNDAPSIALKLDITPANIGSILGSLFVITVLIERFTEVIISITREQKSKTIKVQIRNETKLPCKDQEKSSGDNPNVDPKKIATLNEALVSHKSGTKGFALLLGYSMSVLVCCTGIGILSVVTTNSSEKYFRFLDILLTSSLIAGGSDGFHQFTALLQTFFSENKKLLEGSK